MYWSPRGKELTCGVRVLAIYVIERPYGPTPWAKERSAILEKHFTFTFSRRREMKKETKYRLIFIVTIIIFITIKTRFTTSHFDLKKKISIKS